MLSTHQKILIARGLARAVLAARKLAGRGPEVRAVRQGITWQLDLREGIDFSIYLLGGFEPRTLRRYADLVRPGDTVLDIGANVGSHTLPLARLVGPEGRVHAFEPTAWAFGKQRANVGLNPALAPRIAMHQAMLVAAIDDPLPGSIYSSWPLEDAQDLHAEHRGRLMGTEGAVKETLDGFLARAQVPRVDFVKLDVDGNELAVLSGAKELLRTQGPRMMLELAPYVHADAPQEFDELLDLLWRSGYGLEDVVTGAPLPRDAAGVRARIPERGGLNVLASRPR